MMELFFHNFLKESHDANSTPTPSPSRQEVRPNSTLGAPWKQLQSSPDHPSNQLPRERLCASPGKSWKCLEKSGVMGQNQRKRMHLYREIPQNYHRFVSSLLSPKLGNLMTPENSQKKNLFPSWLTSTLLNCSTCSYLYGAAFPLPTPPMAFEKHMKACLARSPLPLILVLTLARTHQRAISSSNHMIFRAQLAVFFQGGYISLEASLKKTD